MSTEEKAVVDDEEEKRKMLSIFRDESGKSDDWNKKYIHSSLFLLGAGAYGSVFQVTTRLYTQSKQKIAKDRYIYHPDFLATVASQRRLKLDQQDKLKDRLRDERLLDIVAVKYEILEQSHLEDGATRFFLFLRREFLIMDTIWRKFPRLLVGFPMVFDFGYIGDKLQYGVNPKYKNIFTYLNIQGEEVKFFADTHNRNLEGVTKISFMSMELLGPSIDDFRNYFEPWYADNKMKTFFQVRTVFRIADQFLCRLYILHRCGFVHHDLKPDNIAMGNGRAMNTVYLLDFGFAKQVSSGGVSEWMGSRKFISIDAYVGERPNYCQDVESWFYIVLTLLYDALPWSEEFIAPMLGENVEESAKWNFVTNMKRTWWGDHNEAKTLHAMLDNIAKIHSYEIPDIRAILDQLHKKTRDLRANLRQMNDAQTMNAELANVNSNTSKGYMSIRKVLLQIFDLPDVWKNNHVGDSELRVYMEARQEKKYPTYTWDRANFRWEWDRNHERMLSNKQTLDATGGISETQSLALAFSKMSEHMNARRESRDDGSNSPGSGTPGAGGAEAPKPPASSQMEDTDDIDDGHNWQRFCRRRGSSGGGSGGRQSQQRARHNAEESPACRRLKFLLSTMQNAAVDPALRQRARQELMSVGWEGARRSERPDEISYVYDRNTDSLVPKNSGRRHIDSGRCTLRRSFGSGIFSVYDTAEATAAAAKEIAATVTASAGSLQSRHNWAQQRRAAAGPLVSPLTPPVPSSMSQLDTVWRTGIPKVLMKKTMVASAGAVKEAREAAAAARSLHRHRRRNSVGNAMAAARASSGLAGTAGPAAAGRRLSSRRI